MSLLASIEAALARAAIWLLGRLSPVAASNLGGAVARSLGPFLPVSRVADANLRLAFPALDAAARAHIIRAVWDNLGRTVGEMPHLRALTVDVVNEHIPRIMLATGRPLIAITGHIGNWEVLVPLTQRLGINQGVFYRPASNAVVDAAIQNLRQRAAPGVPYFPKGAAGTRAAFAHLRRGGALGMLVDQKLNDGVAVPFFGRDAMTTAAPATLALRLSAIICFVFCERVGPAHLRVVFEQPELPETTSDRAADIVALTRFINLQLEQHIRARPGEWLWLHRRWPK